jgi:hypothetical protein
MLKTSLIALFVSSLSFSACGDGGSGVDGSKDLASLSAEEITEICEYSDSFYSEQERLELNCYVEGIFGESETTDCQTIAAACIAAAEPLPNECAEADEDDFPACASLVTV